jgi:transcriptional regulator GlxA family with amidase domain
MNQQPSPMMVARCARAMQYMDAHLGETITLAHLANAMDVSNDRRVYEAFSMCLGKSPTVALREKRLIKIREKLLNPDHAINVKAARCKYGLFHGGEFAQHYFALFGEKPSDTLRRGKGR